MLRGSRVFGIIVVAVLLSSAAATYYVRVMRSDFDVTLPDETVRNYNAPEEAIGEAEPSAETEDATSSADTVIRDIEATSSENIQP